uniref:DNA-directed DNA polymerase family A palm domain-containing protein n=1 Tax=Caulerpa verticillata TaxID=177082 RepID=A0A386B075_9CHLO|nr:hypothetical protein [Caulerpa verticillata]AYC65063.1 hypothetical protein [Caulerpa verticillata]
MERAIETARRMDSINIQNIHNIVRKIPPYGESEVLVLVNPEENILQNLLNQNSAIALDTEFHENRLAYIQIGFLSSHVVCVLTYDGGFIEFLEIFFKWLQNKNVLIIGFFMLVDLIKIWETYPDAPDPNILLYKVLDLYLFFKYMHNGYKHKNSLAHWSDRLLGVKLDKKYQKTDWFNTPLTEDICNYMVTDVTIVHQWINYVQKVTHLYYTNTWTSKRHFYLEQSYQQDQILLPLFLTVSLQGITILEENLEKETLNQLNTQGELLKYLGLDLEQIKSSKKFTEWLNFGTKPISKLSQDWPKTKTGYLCRDKPKISAWVTKHSTRSEFKNTDILEWFSQFFRLTEVNSLLSFIETFRKHIVFNKIHPLWDLMGADTGRITTSNPALHSIPRNPVARSSVVPSKEHFVFVIADYSTIELAIQAVLADEPTMLRVFKEGLDLHTFLASKVLGTPYEELMETKKTEPKEFKKMRNEMKPVNFGKVYGMGVQTLWDRFLSLGNNITLEKAQHLHSTWDSTFPLIKNYQQKCKNSFYTSKAPLTKLGGTYYITSLGGRLRRPENFGKDRQAALNFTQIVNFPIQATCADFLKFTLKILYIYIQDNKLPITIVLSAHDEIIVECPEKYSKSVQTLLSNIMVSAAQHILSPLLPEAPISVDAAELGG